MAVAEPTIYTEGRDGYGKAYTLLDEVVADTTTSDIEVLGMKAVTIEFTEGGTVLNRSGALTVQGSIDGGVTFNAFNLMATNAAATNAQTQAKVASITRNAAGVDLLAIELSLFKFTHLRFVLDLTDGATPTGNFTLKVLATR